jgi:phosphoribosylanthranilate isomerase
MIIQLYSIRTVEEARLCLEAGVDHLGIVVGEQGRTPDETGFEQAKAVFAVLPGGVPRLALTVETDLDAIAAMVMAVAPDILHLSGDIAGLPLAGIHTLRRQFPGLRIMQAIPVTGPEALDMVRAYEETVDYFLLDTRDAATGWTGATGATHDWSISRQIVHSTRVPVILAGGLSADNVGAAIRAVQPWGVDSNSHTNIPGTWNKDAERVRRFVSAVRDAL